MMDVAYTGNRISALRRQKGWTQKELADRLHVTDKAVSKWERGLNFPELSLLEPLSTVLDTTVQDLLGLKAAPDSMLLESVTKLHRQEMDRLRKKLLLCGCIFVGLGIAVLFSLLLSEQPLLPLWILAAVLFIAGFSVLRSFADPAALFWSGAIRGSRPETMFAFFLKSPPTFQVPPGEDEETPKK